jgi:oligosaccharide repeat unit polymerase
MNQTGFGQVSQGLRVAGFTTVCLLFLLVAVVFGLSSTVTLLGLCAFALAIMLPPAVPWIASRIRDLDLFSPYIAFPIAYVIWFVAGSITFIDVPSGFEGGPFDPIPSRMYALYAWGLAGYFCGLFIGRKVPIRGGTDHREIDLTKMQRIVHLTFLAALALWGGTVLQFSLPILHPSTAGEARLAFHGPLFQGFIWLASTAFVFSPVLVWVRGGKERHDWFWVVGVPFTLSLLILSLGGRSWVAAPLLTLIIAMSYLKRQAGWKLVVAGVLIFCIFSLFGYYREDTGSNEVFLDQIGLPAPVAPFVYVGLYIRYTVDAFRRITETIPSQVPYQYGSITLMPLRTFLPGHQDMSDMFFKNLLGRDFAGSGQPATLLAPLYADFGLSGIFVGMVLYGVLLSWGFQRTKSHSNMITVIFYAWWMQAVIMALYMDGFAYINIYLLPLFWVILFHFSKPHRISGDVPRVVPTGLR